MVTDEQMIAATKAYAGIDGKCRPAAMRAALEAALSASDAPPAVSAKSLEWNGMECHSGKGDLYSIHRLSENVWVARKNGTSISDWHGTEDAAKAAAQADYETRIRSAIISPADTSPVFTVAQIVEKIKDYGQDSMPTSEYRLACDDLVEAFEALAAATKEASHE